MQLKRLYIKDYKILKNFTYDFPYDYRRYTNVIIGINGSGKSTILEAIAEIISCTILNEEAKFSFELAYLLNHEQMLSESSVSIDLETTYFFIEIFADKGSKPQIVVNIPGYTSITLHSISEIKHSEILSSINPLIIDDYKLVLPENIVIYYSGLSEIMNNICQIHNKRLSASFRKGNTNEPIIFYYHEHALFGLILMCLLSYEYGDIPDFLLNKAKITDVQSIQVRLRKPHWANNTIQNFWGAKGEVKNFLDYLEENSATLEDLNNPGQNKNVGNIVIEYIDDEVIIISIITQEGLFKIREHLIDEKALFKVFYIMYLDDMLEDISFSLYKKYENGNRESFSIIGEGEQQAITIRGLSELLSHENTLFLFDEPDTYLHPKWQHQLISEIEESVEQNILNEITYLIATHSPQILSNAKPEKSYIKILEDGQLIENTPKHYGREISSILYNLMGVEERNKTIMNDLSKLFALIEDEDIKLAEKEIERLTDILGETDPDIKKAELQLKYLKENEADN